MTDLNLTKAQIEDEWHQFKDSVNALLECEALWQRLPRSIVEQAEEHANVCQSGDPAVTNPQLLVYMLAVAKTSNKIIEWAKTP
jgi:hypothetical protein